jgi:hypothetical protein
VFVSVVVTVDSFSFQTVLELLATVCKGVPAGISVLAKLQALPDEIHEMPTRDLTTDALNEKTPPTRREPDVLFVLPYCIRVVPLPEKVLLLDAGVSNMPQKYMVHDGAALSLTTSV